MSTAASIDVVYISPRGRRCVLVPSGSALPWLEFRYLDKATLAGGGFYLRRELFHSVMREAPRQSMPSAGYVAATAR
ncbi:MAG: hypothetical protein ABI433_11005 [Burkholderiaceae bacterium]